MIRRRRDEERKRGRGSTVSSHRPSLSMSIVCSACGAEAQRLGSKFCVTCGKLLREEYQPLDTIRASYGLQGKSFAFENQKKEEITNLFELNKNPVSETAWACFVYSLVPYLGVLFIPLTCVIGSFGVIVAASHPQLGGRKLSLISLGLTFPVLVIQIFLWWLLYLIPELAK